MQEQSLRRRNKRMYARSLRMAGWIAFAALILIPPFYSGLPMLKSSEHCRIFFCPGELARNFFQAFGYVLVVFYLLILLTTDEGEPRPVEQAVRVALFIAAMLAIYSLPST